METNNLITALQKGNSLSNADVWANRGSLAGLFSVILLGVNGVLKLIGSDLQIPSGDVELISGTLALLATTLHTASNGKAGV